MKPQKILFPTDLTQNAQTVLGHAVFHAHTYEAELHLLHNLAGSQDDGTDPGSFSDQDEQRVRSRMAEALELHRNANLIIEEHTTNGSSTAQAILDFAENNRIDLIIMGNHGRTGLRQFFLGSVAEEVVRKAPCPVLTIRAGEGIVARPIRKILAPTDFSEQSQKAWAYARQLAESHQACLHLLHVIQNAFHPMGPEPGLQPVADVLPELEAGRCALLAELATEADQTRTHCCVEVGSAYQNIMEYAEREAIDLIVMGSHGYSGLAHLVLGSTAERVMRMAVCPVLVLKCDPGDAPA